MEHCVGPAVRLARAGEGRRRPERIRRDDPLAVRAPGEKHEHATKSTKRSAKTVLLGAGAPPKILVVEQHEVRSDN